MIKQQLKSKTEKELQDLLIYMIINYRNVEMKFINQYIQKFKTRYTTQDGYTNDWVFENYENCKEAQERYKSYEPTNKVFLNFVQTIFTAGSEKQFIKYGIDELKGDLSINYKTKIKNTFDYIFYKMKKGIFVQIYNNKINIFLPITNANYKNEWYNNIKPPKDYYRRCPVISNIYVGE